MAIFEIKYFQSNPKAFCTLAKELYPGEFDPTPTHFFLKLLENKGLLKRNFTQNIDGLEFIAGLSEEKVVQAHGGFQKAHCIKCKKAYEEKWVKDILFKDEIPMCTCGGLVKPDIVFFGEGLPARFHQLSSTDFGKCDCLIVMGTSLKVQPFASLIDLVPENCIRVLLNNELAGVNEGISGLDESTRKLIEQLKASNDPEHKQMLAIIRMRFGGMGFAFGEPGNVRDVFHKCDCDSGCLALADLLGWRSELDALIGAQKQKSK